MKEPDWIHPHIRWHIWEAPGWVTDTFVGDWLLALLCLIFEHKPVRDQCGLPAHDFCVYCNKSMPEQAIPPQEANP